MHSSERKVLAVGGAILIHLVKTCITQFGAALSFPGKLIHSLRIVSNQHTVSFVTNTSSETGKEAVNLWTNRLAGTGGRQVLVVVGGILFQRFTP